ncbi:MAG: membrane protein insertase YidC [Oscillospiraceae bacterium]|nr:membrane protein insertase YidC [Oscillospiraceae bacterium]
MRKFSITKILILTLAMAILLAGFGGVFASAEAANDYANENDVNENGNNDAQVGLDPNYAQSPTADDGFNLLGIFEFVFGNLFGLLYRVAGENYLFTLILFTIILSVVLLPFDIMQRKNMIKQAGFRPIELAINKKYKGRTNDRETQMKRNQETMDAKRERGVPTFGGCLPLLLQMPIFIALFAIVRNPLLYISQISYDALIAIQQAIVGHGFENTGRNLADQAQIVGYLRNYINPDLATYCATLSEQLSDYITYAGLPNLHAFGVDISPAPSSNWISWLLLVPILTFATSFVFSRINAKYNYRPVPADGTPGGGAGMKVMEYMAPAMAVLFSIMWSASMGVYWIFRSIMQSITTLILARIKPLPTFTEEELKAAEKEYLGKTKEKNSRLPANHGPREGQRSLHYIDADEDDAPPPPPKKQKKAEGDSSTENGD